MLYDGVGEEKGYGHAGEVANGARSTCLPSLACFTGRVCRRTVWAYISARVCVYVSRKGELTCMRAYLVHVYTYMYASACTRMFCAHSFMGRLHCSVTVVSTCSFSLDIFRTFLCVKKKGRKRKREKRRKTDLLPFTFIFADKNDVTAKRKKKERAVIKSVTKTRYKYFNVSPRN